jgi:hypothetical protein
MVSRSRVAGGELRSVPLGLRIKPSLREELDRLAEAVDERSLAMSKSCSRHTSTPRRSKRVSGDD